MQFNKKTVAAVALGISALVGGAYFIGKQQAGVAPTASAPGAPQTAGQGAFKYSHFRVGNANVKSIFVDGKIAWVGTSNGVIRYDTTTDQFKHYDNRSGLLSNGVFYIGKLKGMIAVGTYGGGMSLLDEKTGTWKQYNIPQGMGDAFVYEAMQVKNGDIWIATWSGVNRVRGGDLDDRSKWDLFTVETTNGGLPNDWVYGLAEGKNDDVWLATEGGMAHFSKDGQWQNWNHSKGIGVPYEKVKDAIEYKNDPGKASMHHAKQKQEMGLEGVNVAFNPNYIVALEVARDGKIWAGTWGGGLSIYDGSKWTNYSSLDGLPGNHVFSIHQDAKGTIWIGTSKGLARWDNGKFVVMTTADGLFANDVFSLATMDDGSMWVGSFGGVAFLRPNKP